MDWTNLGSADVLESMEEVGTWPWAGPREAESEDLPLHRLSIALTVAVGSGRALMSLHIPYHTATVRQSKHSSMELFPLRH